MEQGKYLEIILTQQFKSLEIVATTSMTWWVSSIVFCSSVIALFWFHKDEVCKLPIKIFKRIIFVLNFFFFSVVLYGVLIILHTIKIGYDICKIISLIGFSETISNYDAVSIILCVALGTTTFICVWSTWRAMSKYLKTKYQDELNADNKESLHRE